MKRRAPMTPTEQLKELRIAKRYLKDSIDEYNDYPIKNDLIGRALADQVERMKTIWNNVQKGIPFGVGRNR